MRIAYRVVIVAALLVLTSGLAHAADAAKPTVTCKDGTSAPGGRGACRGHGGVDKTATGTTKSAPAAPAPAPPTAPPAASANAPATHKAPAAPTAEKASGTKAATSDAAGALAKCKDGMYWHGTKHSGSCSHHGGVAEWFDGSQKQ
jgi:hypothetical protein